MFQLVPRKNSLSFNFIDDGLSNALDSAILALPASVPRGFKIQVVRPPRCKCVCFGSCAARGHIDINKFQPALRKLSLYDQEVLLKYVEHSHSNEIICQNIC